ncbi:hypothetical protein BJX61DRAFT_409504 [Aspergillus egyptiacus]|nr:hypothetical protein BJX61DRAFT_409504 [Aspergillus egyptiacus]
MPPKRRTRASNKPTAEKPPHPSPPKDHDLEKPPLPMPKDSSPPTYSEQPVQAPTEPMTPEEHELSEPIPEIDEDEEMPEEGEHTIGEVKGGEKQGFAGGYNALKSYKGQYYSGMAVGGSHTWNYDPGVWKETKEEPDLWRIDYRTNKRRARNAPKGSGAPVGTEYHWFIVAHQHVKKIDANTYETVLEGSKYKLAYKSADSNSWSVPTVRKQREREVQLLEDAKARVQGLPPVSEKVKVEKQEKGQVKLDAMFGAGNIAGKKRKAEDGE